MIIIVIWYMTWYCYCIVNDKHHATYIGSSVCPERRLRQHNGELKGGAIYTTKRLSKGQWLNVCVVEGFPDSIAALQFEWQWKHLTRLAHKKPNSQIRSTSTHNLVKQRILALAKLLVSGHSTSKSLAFSQYPCHLTVKWNLTCQSLMNICTTKSTAS